MEPVTVGSLPAEINQGVKLRSKLLALSLLTLLLPWSAWKLLQELERFLRESQETSLLATAETLSSALPLQFRSQLMFLPEHTLPLRRLPRTPVLDGYPDDWPQADQFLSLGFDTDQPVARVLAASDSGLIHLLIEVVDETPVRTSPENPSSQADSVRISLRTPRGIQSWNITPGAPGPLRIASSGPGISSLEGFWLETTPDPQRGLGSGYRLEVTLPVAVQPNEPGLELLVEVADVKVPGGGVSWLAGGSQGSQWLSLVTQWPGLSAWLATVSPRDTRTLLVDQEGWVLADSGAREEMSPETTLLQRLLYRLVSDDRPTIAEPFSATPARLADAPVTTALQGLTGSVWAQEFEDAVVHNTVAVPVSIEERVMGALVIQSRSEGLLLITNRALGQLLLTTLVLMLGLTAGLWYFASRLSRRVQRLSGAVSEAMEDGVPSSELPLTTDKDELGELARNNAVLLRAVSDYTRYLQTLAGKLSHELKTPLAITRSSLDNLSSLPLDEDARRFLERAREGLDRQGEIVRAMSEASRLEQSIQVAEWEEINLGELVSGMVESYNSIHPGRKISAVLPDDSPAIRCAPDLLAQALDKLVDNAVTLSGEEDEIRISVERGQDETRLAVWNSGTRLPDSLRERLFDSLVSLREGSGDAPHLGLGLYIVRLVAEAHGGQASAANSDGGVEFTIALPVPA